MKQICKYNIIRFQPYVETQEFANIGIIMYLPNSQSLLFKLLPSTQSKRITDFFSPLERSVFQHSISICKDHLQQSKNIITSIPQAYDFYKNLIAASENIIRYSDSRTMLITVSPQDQLEQLFNHYVNRSFTRNESHEERMRAQIRDLLKSKNLAANFKERDIGTEIYKVNFPFVKRDNNDLTIIKPIHFQHSHSSKLIEHGDNWLNKIRRLKSNNLIEPKKVLFAYEKPKTQNGVLADAFHEVIKGIRKFNITTCPSSDQEAITYFAKNGSL